MKVVKSCKKGFTLAELAVALAVTIFLMGSIATLLTLVINQADQSEHDSQVEYDLSRARVALSAFYDKYSVYSTGEDGYRIEAGGDSGQEIVIYSGESKVGAASFDGSNKILKFEGFNMAYIQFDFVDDIRFEVFDVQVVKLLFFYDGKPNPQVILLMPMEF